MTSLTLKELDLLKRIDARPKSIPIFFRKVKGIKWFNELNNRDFFAAQNNPRPQDSTVEGHVFVPVWHVLDYLEKTTEELNENQNEEYFKKFVAILLSVTEFARIEQYSNYRTWWKFAQIIANIPSKYLSESDLEVVDYWLDDSIDTSLVSETIGVKWIPTLLLDHCDNHSHQLALKLVSLLFKVKLDSESNSFDDSHAVRLRIEAFQCREIIDHISKPLGKSLGARVLPRFESDIERILKHLDSDHTSVIWRSAIEEHEQNRTLDQPIDLLIDIFRDTLNAYLATNTEESIDYVTKLLKSNFKVLRRIAIHAIDVGFQSCNQLFDLLLKPQFWEELHYKHELWTLLNHQYKSLNESQREAVLNNINSIVSNTDTSSDQSLAYRKASWLAAIQKYGEEEEQAYRKYVKLANAEPEHPSFQIYIQSGSVMPKSPISLDQMSKMNLPELIMYLDNFKEDRFNFFESPIDGLFNTFRQLIKFHPVRFAREIRVFDNIGLRYTYQIIEAYRELWTEKASLTWTDIWDPLLQFCQRLVCSDRFWNEENSKSMDPMIPNRKWVVGSIASLIESGVNHDDHAFDPKFLDIAEDIVVGMLGKQKGGEFENDNNAVFNAINSARGKCINALIKLALRRCRLADKSNHKDHSAVWSHFEHLFDRELENSSTSSYEVPTLFSNYLPSLLYMCPEWTFANLDRIYPDVKGKWWKCAMEGYASVSTFNEKIFRYLRDKGHFKKVLDDDTLYDRTQDRVIEDICIAYLCGIESLDTDTDLINIVISRNNQDELRRLVLEFWRFGKDNPDLVPKIIEFWCKVLTKIDLESQEGQSVASYLCLLAEIIEEVDKTTRDLVITVAPFASVEHNTYHMFKWIEQISESQPYEAYVIWKSMIKFSTPTYPEKSIKTLLKNIVEVGNEGVIQAHEIAEIYTEGENLVVYKWLKEVLAGS